jgi:hypothetical protein
MMASGVQADGIVRDQTSFILSGDSLTATHNFRGGLPIELGATGLPDGDEELKNDFVSIFRAFFAPISESIRTDLVVPLGGPDDDHGDDK